MKTVALKAEKRTVVGSKVKKLRQNNQIPANIFGKNIPSVSISVLSDAFAKVFAQTGETGLVNLSLDGQDRPVLIKQVQVHPVKDTLLHIDFYQVDLKEKVKAQVPLKIVGSSPAIANNVGIVLQLANEISVEALPTDLPEHIDVDISKLKEVGEVVKVSAIVLPTGVTILTEPETEIVKIGQLVTKEAEAEAAQEEAEKAAAAAAAPEAGATPGAPAPTAEIKPQAPPPAKTEK